jgi:NAD(P) transhydrogenase subunit alpha
MFGKNIANLLALFVKEGNLEMDMADEIIAGTLLTDGGEIVHKMAREIFGLEPLTPVAAGAAETASEGSDT